MGDVELRARARAKGGVSSTPRLQWARDLESRSMTMTTPPLTGETYYKSCTFTLFFEFHTLLTLPIIPTPRNQQSCRQQEIEASSPTTPDPATGTLAVRAVVLTLELLLVLVLIRRLLSVDV